MVESTGWVGQPSRRTLALLVGAVALALVVGALAIRAWGPSGFGEDETRAASCTVTTIDVVVAPRFADALEPALDAIKSDCVEFEVRERTQSQALDEVFAGGPAPDLWIPDGDTALTKMPVTVVTQSLASTPVLLAGGPRAARQPTWAAALSSEDVALPDPLTDIVGALAMVAPTQEASVLQRPAKLEKAVLVPLAQRYGELAAEGKTVDLSLEKFTAGSTRVVAVTEAELSLARASNKQVRSVTPRTGAPKLTFPLAVSSIALPQTRASAEELAQWFGTDEGVETLAKARLRGPDAEILRARAGGRNLTFLPDPATSKIDKDRLTWRTLSVPSSVLAVFDVSGSMDFLTPANGRRVDVAVGAAQVALSAFPGHARIGLWVFSIDQGGPGQDWRALEPVRRLDAEVPGGPTQRDLLLARADQMADLTTGGTGLNDTALAAYRQAVQTYDPNYSNTMILLTDGANDDPGSITESDLIERLELLVNPQRPVRIIGVAISDDADLEALQRIAKPTGGRAYRADTPGDILEVFASEIAKR